MSREEPAQEMAAGVEFRGLANGDDLVAVMGRQDKGEVVLIRHAYVRTAWQRRGLGSRLLTPLLADVDRPVLVDTWRAATWAIRFYEQHGFRLVFAPGKDRLLRSCWDISPLQVQTSVVLADRRWLAGR